MRVLRPLFGMALAVPLFFAAPLVQAEWVDISSSVEISQTPRVFDHVNRRISSYVTLANTSSKLIAGELHLDSVWPGRSPRRWLPTEYTPPASNT